MVADSWSSTRIAIPTTPTPSRIFVHGGWTGRIAMRLAGAGMRLDSVETVLHQNSTCAVDAFAKAYVGAQDGERRTIVPSLVFTPFPKRPLLEAKDWPGVRGEPGEQLTPPCGAELNADRTGLIDVAPLGWQGDLPGLGGTGSMLARDLGPDANRSLIRAFPERRPWVLYRPSSDAPPVLAPYDSGMTVLWGHS